MAEARDTRDFGIERFLTDSPVPAYSVVQTPSGQAGFLDSAVAAAAGQYIEVRTTGTAMMGKSTGHVALKGGRAYWSHSSNVTHFQKSSDRDFYCGRYAQDAIQAANFCEVLLNVDPPYDHDLARDPFNSVLVGTAAAGGFGYPARLGGAHIFELTATDEAQKVDALAVDGFSPAANAIVEGAFRILSDGTGATPDFSVGIANDTHASSADTIAESLLVHLDGNNTTINLESDDGTTEVAATDTTEDYVEGSDLTSRVEFWMDLRNPADIQCYIDGVLVLSGSTFRLDNATGPLRLLVHLEKTSSTDVYKAAVDWLRVRIAEQ